MVRRKRPGMEQWRLRFSKQAIKDSFLLRDKKLDDKARKLLEILKSDPYQSPQSFEKLVGLDETYSRRINITHRLVYRVKKDERVIEVVSMFRHYR